MNGLMSIFTGLLTYACSHYQGVMKNWQLMFMILGEFEAGVIRRLDLMGIPGILTVVWGFTALFWVPDSPTSAKVFASLVKWLDH